MITLKKVREIAKIVQEAGLTPFDLIDWIYLLQLEAKTEKFENFIDLDVHFALREEVLLALQRKAEMLDAHHDTDFHRSMIKRLDTEINKLSKVKSENNKTDETD